MWIKPPDACKTNLAWYLELLNTYIDFLSLSSKNLQNFWRGKNNIVDRLIAKFETARDNKCQVGQVSARDNKLWRLGCVGVGCQDGVHGVASLRLLGILLWFLLGRVQESICFSPKTPELQVLPVYGCGILYFPYRSSRSPDLHTWAHPDTL